MKKFSILFLCIITIQCAALADINQNSTNFYKQQLQNANTKYNVHNFKKAVKNGDKKTVELFFEAGMKPDVIYLCRHVLVIPIDRKQDDIFNLFMDAKLDPNFESLGVTMLSYAVVRKNEYVVKKLIEAGADIDKKCRGFTPLMIALKVGQPKIANILIDAGANINARNVLGYKPLDFAIANNYTSVAKKLVAAGATVSSAEFVELAKNSNDINIRNLSVSTVSMIKTPIINNATFNKCK